MFVIVYINYRKKIININKQLKKKINKKVKKKQRNSKDSNRHNKSMFFLEAFPCVRMEPSAPLKHRTVCEMCSASPLFSYVRIHR